LLILNVPLTRDEIAWLYQRQTDSETCPTAQDSAARLARTR